VGALSGFLSTWSAANATFGDGTPADGARFDQSAQLREMQQTVQSAAPGSLWTGGGAASYADANIRHANVLGSLADLDKRLGTEVDRSATIVANGRRDLAAVRKWVVDAAATVPDNAAGQRMLYPIVSKAAADVAEIVKRSNDDLAAIGERIRKIGSEYDELGEPEEGQGAHVVDDKLVKVPPTTLDLDDIVQTGVYDEEGRRILGPPGYKELVPNSGTWVPDPQSPLYRPNPVVAPLDLNRIVQTGVYDRQGNRIHGPAGYVELVPNSGTWVPDPRAVSPGASYPAPEAPLDLNDIHVYGTVDAGGRPIFGMPWEMELVPHSGVWVPDPSYGKAR